MSVTPHEIAKVGDTLITDSNEPFQRSAVSRHFYAAYHRCGAWKDALPGVASAGGYQGGGHQTLLNQLRAPDRQCSDVQKKRSKFLATKLEILRNRRVLAEYLIADPLLPGEAATQQVQANAIIAECDANP